MATPQPSYSYNEAYDDTSDDVTGDDDDYTGDEMEETVFKQDELDDSSTRRLAATQLNGANYGATESSAAETAEGRRPKDPGRPKQRKRTWRSIFLVGCGYVCAVLGFALLAASAGCAQALGGFVPAFELNLFRYAVTFVSTIPFVICKNVKVTFTRKRAAFWVILYCAINSVYNVTFYTAAIYLPLATLGGLEAIVVMLFSAAITMTVSQRCKAEHLVASILCVAGGFLLLQPPVLFRDVLSHNKIVTTPLCFHSSGSDVILNGSGPTTGSYEQFSGTTFAHTTDIDADVNATWNYNDANGTTHDVNGTAYDVSDIVYTTNNTAKRAQRKTFGYTTKDPSASQPAPDTTPRGYPDWTQGVNTLASNWSPDAANENTTLLPPNATSQASSNLTEETWSTSSQANQEKSQTNEDYTISDEAKGYTLLGIASASFLLQLYLMNYPLKGANVFMLSFWKGLIGVLISVPFMFTIETPTFPESLSCILLLFGHSVSLSLSSIMLTFSMLVIPPLVLGLLTSLQMAFFWTAQYTLLRNINPGQDNAVEIAGAGLILLASATGPTYQMCYESDEEDEEEDDFLFLD